jgi:hypothetical protein
LKKIENGVVMADLREKVKEDRGLLKKIEMAIPGFRGYRKREDLRIADSVLRRQLADKLRTVGRDMEQCREGLTKKMEMTLIEDAGKLVSQLYATEGKMRHAEQGYTGVSADYRIEEDELNKLYEWDLSLISHIDNLTSGVNMLQEAINSGDANAMSNNISNLNRSIREFNELFEQRRDAIAGLGVGE